MPNFNNEELKEVVGGEGGTSNHKFQNGDWLEYKLAFSPQNVYYVSDVLENQYHIFSYSSVDRIHGECTKQDHGLIPHHEVDLYYIKTNKPYWIKD